MGPCPAPGHSASFLTKLKLHPCRILQQAVIQAIQKQRNYANLPWGLKSLTLKPEPLAQRLSVPLKGRRLSARGMAPALASPMRCLHRF